MRRGISLAEVLVVITIIAVLSAIAFPALSSSRRAARESECTAHLRQLWLATSIYRAEGDGTFGDPTQMGLPPSISTLVQAKLVPVGIIICRGDDPLSGYGKGGYASMWMSADLDTRIPKWTDEVVERRDATPMIIDHCHDFKLEGRYSPYLRHKVLSLTLGGSVIKKVKVGDIFSFGFYRE